MAKYKAKHTCVGSIPFWVGDLVGIDSYNKLNDGGEVSIAKPQPQVLEFLEVVKEKKSSKKEVEESEEE